MIQLDTFNSQYEENKKASQISLYEQIAQIFENEIITQALQFGDKLPSIRCICRDYKVSMSTALQAYYQLASRSLIEARPQSGYYVSYSPKQWLRAPKPSEPTLEAGALPINDVIQRVYPGLTSDKNITQFSLGVPANSLLPIPKLNKALVQSMRQLAGNGTGYSAIEGNETLRRSIAAGAFQWGGRLTHDHLITTNGCTEAIAYCLMAVTEPGDTVIVESPAYFGILQLAQSLGLKIMELPTNPETGIELDALKIVFKTKKIAACILMTNFNNPLGSCMPAEHKREAVKLIEHFGIPLIEDDIYADLYFNATRPSSCKSYDESGLVLWCGSVSKTLAPGYRVGWVAPGRFYEKIRNIKLFKSFSSATLTEEVVATFLKTGRYDNHLRNLRKALCTNYHHYIRAIGDHFPDNTKVSQPKGGFFLWLSLDRKIDTTQLFEIAERREISIAPGRMFTMQNQFNNCLRLSYGLSWTHKLDISLKTLGRLIHTFK